MLNKTDPMMQGPKSAAELHSMALSMGPPAYLANQPPMQQSRMMEE